MASLEYTYNVGDTFCHKDDPSYKIKIIHVGENEYDYTSNSIQKSYCIIRTNNNFTPPIYISAVALNKYYTLFRENRAKIP
jgi:hypothetical protein